MQTGLECIGDVDMYNLCEVISLAARSLDAIHPANVLELSHMGVVSALVSALDLDSDVEKAVVRCIGEKNADGIRALCPGKDVSGVLQLVAAHGAPERVISALAPHCRQGLAKAALDELRAVTDNLSELGHDAIQVDFSSVNDMNYYNGIVFMGYIEGIPSGVLSGGQYDKLMQRMGRRARAVGFAIYMDQLERLDNEKDPYDVDTLLIYPENADVTALARAIRGIADTGLSVTAQRAIPAKLKYRQLVRFEEVAPHA